MKPYLIGGAIALLLSMGISWATLGKTRAKWERETQALLEDSAQVHREAIAELSRQAATAAARRDSAGERASELEQAREDALRAANVAAAARDSAEARLRLARADRGAQQERLAGATSAEDSLGIYPDLVRSLEVERNGLGLVLEASETEAIDLRVALQKQIQASAELRAALASSDSGLAVAGRRDQLRVARIDALEKQLAGRPKDQLFGLFEVKSEVALAIGAGLGLLAGLAL